jgi:uncharacterized protein (DUF2147 family)
VGITVRSEAVRARLLRLIFHAAVVVAIAVLACGRRGSAQGPNAYTPVGRWKTVDDISGKINSVVGIWEADGKLYGRIEKLIDGDPNDPDPRCVRCSGDLKDRRLVGLRILWDLTPDGNRWTGGEILDPDSGRIYRCSIALDEDGKKLRVRGFIGFSLLGRTQYWLRDE